MLALANGVTWKEFFLALKGRFIKDKLMEVAGSVTFFGVLALFPFLLFLVTLAGLVLQPQQVEQFIREIGNVAPADATTNHRRADPRHPQEPECRVAHPRLRGRHLVGLRRRRFSDGRAQRSAPRRGSTSVLEDARSRRPHHLRRQCSDPHRRLGRRRGRADRPRLRGGGGAPRDMAAAPRGGTADRARVGSSVSGPAGYAAEVPAPHAGIGGGGGRMADRFLGIFVLRPALRRVQQDIRRHRRRGRDADVDVDLCNGALDRRAHQRRARGSVAPGPGDSAGGWDRRLCNARPRRAAAAQRVLIFSTGSSVRSSTRLLPRAVPSLPCDGRLGVRLLPMCYSPTSFRGNTPLNRDLGGRDVQLRAVRAPQVVRGTGWRTKAAWPVPSRRGAAVQASWIELRADHALIPSLTGRVLKPRSAAA